jgi:biopolymer transport protein ExbB/TolQ
MITTQLTAAAALLVLAALVLESVRFFRKHRGDVGELATRLRDCLRDGDLDATRDAMARSNTAEAAVLVAGLLEAYRGASAAREAMAGALVLQRLNLERRVGLLGALGVGLPLVGLLGALVTGGREPAAAGLAVGLLALVAWWVFRSRARAAGAQAEALAHVLVSYLVAPPIREAAPASDELPSWERA